MKLVHTTQKYEGDINMLRVDKAILDTNDVICERISFRFQMMILYCQVLLAMNKDYILTNILQ